VALEALADPFAPFVATLALFINQKTAHHTREQNRHTFDNTFDPVPVSA
jgi:hypothetical protein